MHYTAITIGPIYKTFEELRRTRELWGASYLFSFIMRRLIEEINEDSKCCLPYHPELRSRWKGKGAGLFPDRLIIRGDIKDQIVIAESKIVKEISTYTSLPEDYLKNYIHIYAISYSLPKAIKQPVDHENIILLGNELLNTTELKEKHYVGDIDGIDWRTAIDKINGKLFYKEAFDKSTGFTFPSIIEIATDDFKQKNEAEYEKLRSLLNDHEDNDQKTFLKALAGENPQTGNPLFNPIKVRPYHKYIAVVQADGDNIGKTIQQIGKDKETVQKFSAALFEFALAANDCIKSYGGKPVYIGGDDLLFFAPVAVHDRNIDAPLLNSIFSLIADIDRVFAEKIINNTDLRGLYEVGGALTDRIPSMSYGISITYVKYPLNEARENAYNLLRKAKEKKDDKNKVCFKLHKHSGQGFGFTVDKKKTNTTNPRSFDYFLNLVSNVPEDKDFLSSVIYKLSQLSTLLNSTLASTNPKERLAAFFDQEFELEKLRKKKAEHNLSTKELVTITFLDNVRDYYFQLFLDFPKDNKPLPSIETEESDSNIAKLYSTLRFTKHLIAEDEQ